MSSTSHVYLIFFLRFKFDGPLPIYPPSDDDYGMEDASSLIVLKTTPPMVVIATSSGRVYHSMLLSFGTNDENVGESYVMRMIFILRQ